MKSFANLSIILLALLYAANVKAQGLGWTKDNIVAKEGINYSTENAGGSYFIKYLKDANKNLEMSSAYYFDNKDVCIKWANVYPIERLTSIIGTLKEFVKIGDLEWRDYNKNIRYHIILEDKVFGLVVSYAD